MSRTPRAVPTPIPAAAPALRPPEEPAGLVAELVAKLLVWPGVVDCVGVGVDVYYRRVSNCSFLF